MSDDQGDKHDAGKAVQDIHPAPGHVTEAKQIGISRKERRAHAAHHQDACPDDRESGKEDGQVVQLVFQWVFGELAWRGSGLTQSAPQPSGSVLQVHAVRPDRPKVQPERGMEQVINHGDGKDDPGDPMVGDPGEFDAHLGEESSKQKREHGERHHCMEESRAERVPRDAFGDGCGDPGGSAHSLARMRFRGFRPVADIKGMHNQKQQTAN